MDVILIGAFQLLPGLCGSVMRKFVFALAGKEVAEIRSQEQRHSIWKVFGPEAFVEAPLPCNTSPLLGLKTCICLDTYTPDNFMNSPALPVGPHPAK